MVSIKAMSSEPHGGKRNKATPVHPIYCTAAWTKLKLCLVMENGFEMFMKTLENNDGIKYGIYILFDGAIASTARVMMTTTLHDCNGGVARASAFAHSHTLQKPAIS